MALRKSRPLVVLDTNVLISAARAAKTPEPSQSAAWRVVALWKRGFLQLVVSPEIVAEYLMVLARFDLTARELDAWAQWFTHASKVTVVAQPRRVKASRDPKDDPFLSAALTASVPVIVSRDDDLLVLNTYEGIEILTPAQYLESRRLQEEVKRSRRTR